MKNFLTFVEKRKKTEHLRNVKKCDKKPKNIGFFYILISVIGKYLIILLFNNPNILVDCRFSH